MASFISYEQRETGDYQTRFQRDIHTRQGLGAASLRAVYTSYRALPALPACLFTGFTSASQPDVKKRFKHEQPGRRTFNPESRLYSHKWHLIHALFQNISVRYRTGLTGSLKSVDPDIQNRFIIETISVLTSGLSQAPRSGGENVRSLRGHKTSMRRRLVATRSQALRLVSGSARHNR
jgi:hypothetical protein